MIMQKPPSYLYLSIAVLWLYSGIAPVLFAQASSLELLTQLGVSAPYRWLLFIGSAALDLTFGLLILTGYRERAWLWLLQLVVVAGYSVIIGIGLPDSWLHPFAPLIKNLPIMALLLYFFQWHSFK